MRKKGMEAVEDGLEQILMARPWSPGETLPSERQLSETFGVARHTVRAALQRLAARGVIELRQGRRPRVPEDRHALTLSTAAALLGRGPHVPLARHRLLGALLDARRLVAVHCLSLCCESPHENRAHEVHDALLVLRRDVLVRHDAEQALRGEFALWGAAARAGESGGLQLLVHTLEHAFLSMEHLLEPALPLHRMREWIEPLSAVLYRRDVAWVRQELPLHLEACDHLLREELASPRERQLQEHLRAHKLRTGEG